MDSVFPCGLHSALRRAFHTSLGSPPGQTSTVSLSIPLANSAVVHLGDELRPHLGGITGIDPVLNLSIATF